MVYSFLLTDLINITLGIGAPRFGFLPCFNPNSLAQTYFVKFVYKRWNSTGIHFGAN